jgi:nucleotide-binding universal stress UspA family protein
MQDAQPARRLLRGRWLVTILRKLLLVTDLGPRSDRALDRAAALAAHGQAKLVVLHAREISGRV